MIDEDFYIEQSSPRKIFFSCLLILFVIGAGIGAFYYFSNKDIVKLKNVTVELGAKVPTDINKYLKGKNINKYTLDVSAVHVDEAGMTDSVGEYSYKVTNGNIDKSGKIFVKDTTAPSVETQDLTVGVNEEFEADDFILTCTDLSNVCFVSYVKEADADLNQNEGIYDISINIKDKYDNVVTKKVKLTVSDGASLSSLKAEDKEVATIYPKDDNWDHTFTYEFAKGVVDESPELEDKLLAISNVDYTDKYDKEIIDKTIIVAYNKYGFVLGLSVRLDFADETRIYVPK